MGIVHLLLNSRPRETRKDPLTPTSRGTVTRGFRLHGGLWEEPELVNTSMVGNKLKISQVLRVDLTG